MNNPGFKACLPAALCLFLLAAGRELSRAQQQPSTQLLVLRGGLLIDGTGRAPLENPVVILSGNKIQSVGTEGSVTVPAGATVINTTGKTIIPGLVDSHVHYRNLLAPWFLYWGVTTVGDMANVPGWIFAEKRAVETGRSIGPYIMTVGHMINGRRRSPQDIPGPGELAGVSTFLSGNSYQTYVSDEASIEAGIAESQQWGADAVKLYRRMDPALMRAAARIGRQRGFRVFAHFTSANPRLGMFLGTDEILDTGIDVHVHTYGLIKATAPADVRERIAKGEAVEAWHLLDTGKFPALAQAVVDKMMFLNPTLGSEFVLFSRHREEFDRLQTAFLQGPVGAVLPEASRGRYLAMYKPYRGEHAGEMAEGYRRVGTFVKEFVQRGGKVIAGTDAGPSAQAAGLSLHVEMRLLEEVGLTPMQALQSATSWAMEAWGKGAEAGTIEVGKRADLVILNRNPLDDLTATRDIAEVIQGGKIVDREALARWKDALPRPTPMQAGVPNPLIRIPLIHDLAPDSLRVSQRNAPELILQGENFTARSQVLFNDRLIPAKFYSETRLGVSLRTDWLREPGVFPLVVVQPGSGGGVSNPFYLVVTSDQ